MTPREILLPALAEVGLKPCGDNSCMFGAPGGMATNGGCRCLDEYGPPANRVIARKLARVLQDMSRTIAALIPQKRKRPR